METSSELRSFEQEIISDFKTFSGGKSRPRKGVWVKGHLLDVNEDYVYSMWEKWNTFVATANLLGAKIETGNYTSFSVYIFLLKKTGLLLPTRRERAKAPSPIFFRQYYRINRRKLVDPRWHNPYIDFPSWRAMKSRGFQRPKKKPRRPRAPMFPPGVPPLPPGIAPARLDKIWNRTEHFLREHGYTLTREELETIIPDWGVEAAEYKILKEQVGYVIHEAVEIEEVRKVARRLISPREAPEPVASRAHEIAERLQNEWLTS